MSKNMVKCIYCLQDKHLSDFNNREHVIPQCFGRFNATNFVLHNTVCDECNKYFGNNIELYLGRDTFEGIERYKYGIKPKKQPKHKRMRFKISEGKHKGLIVTPVFSGNAATIDIDLVLQVGIYNSISGEFDYFEPADVPSIDDYKKKGMQTSCLPVILIDKNDAERKFLNEILEDKGFSGATLEGDIGWPNELPDSREVQVTGSIKIDRIIYRGFCKIVFNYLAAIYSKNFVLSENFNKIRNFIRYDEGNDQEFFAVNQQPILENDKESAKFNTRETHGHLITLDWNNKSIEGRISLFNTNTYLVRLCEDYSGVWVPIKSGHHFDVKTMEIHKLCGVNRALIPTREELRKYFKLRGK